MCAKKPTVTVFVGLLLLALSPVVAAAGCLGDPPVAHLGDSGSSSGGAPLRVVVREGGEWRLYDGLPEVSRAYLGVEVMDLTRELRHHFEVPEETGVMISRVEPGSPAARSGLEVGDIVTAVEGEPVGSARDLSRQILRREEGDRLQLELYRDGQRRRQTATLAKAEVRLGSSLRYLPLAQGAVSLPVEIGREVREAIENAAKAWQDPELQERIRYWRGYAEESERQLEERLKELEKRLRELEKEFQQR